MSRLMFGARVSLGVGFISVALAALVGVPLGLWGGYILGIYDSILMGIVDAILAFPAILLAMVMVGILGPSPKNVTIALAVVFLPRFVRIARASMLTQRALPYVESAQAIGAPQYYIVARTILPNAVGPILVQMAVAMAEAILLEAGLSFLGLGIQPPNPSWGLMIGTAKSLPVPGAVVRRRPWHYVGPRGPGLEWVSRWDPKIPRPPAAVSLITPAIGGMFSSWLILVFCAYFAMLVGIALAGARKMRALSRSTRDRRPSRTRADLPSMPSSVRRGRGSRQMTSYLSITSSDIRATSGHTRRPVHWPAPSAVGPSSIAELVRTSPQPPAGERR